MKRRDFIKGLAAASLIDVVSSAKARAADTAVPAAAGDPHWSPDSDPVWVRDVRRRMPVCQEMIYLQTGSFGPSPINVVDRVRELMDVQLKGPAEPRYAEVLSAAENSCRPLIAELLGARPEEVALTHNATEGLNIVLWSIDWKPGDEIVISNHEHEALRMPCYNLRDRFQIRYRQAAIDTGQDVVANVLAELSPRTRLVAMSHVSRRNGRVIPVRELAAELHRKGIRLLLDGAQAAGNVAFNFADSGCDYYSLCGHKWLLGPKGTGGLLVRRDLLERTPVSYTGAHGQRTESDSGKFEWWPSGRRYEYATRAQYNFGGFAETLRWLDGLGHARVFQRIQDLSLWAATLVQRSDKFELVSPIADGSRSGIVVIRLPKGSSAGEICTTLDDKDRILVSPLENPRDVRVSLHFFNTRTEFETLLGRLGHYC